MSPPAKSGGELFIVDNSDEAWKGLKYLQDWTEIASSFDIATGFFEIGSLLALDGKWQKLENIRILMGDQATVRTRQALLDGLRKHACRKLDASLEAEKETNDLLAGTAAIVEAMRQGKIQCRVYPRTPVFRRDGSLIDYLQNFAIDRWEAGDIPAKPGEYRNIPAAKEDTFIKTSGQLCMVGIEIHALVAEQLYFGQMPLENVRGFSDEVSGGLVTTGFTTAIINVAETERSWPR
jgi:hypothetical protein